MFVIYFCWYCSSSSISGSLLASLESWAEVLWFVVEMAVRPAVCGFASEVFTEERIQSSDPEYHS